ncbi:hypothetical protein [Streptomyces sp. JJ36]|uniref:hypothetical protein n=1 Tax=Streptomyces sp. JJ36 TaxID=2736645 RepID=UPI001F426151|nr:hypothetical protein [Streptomyces sp. JJ36]MCF6526497.1 hypothetical protein [Streptomyces sp. JJ36]
MQVRKRIPLVAAAAAAAGTLVAGATGPAQAHSSDDWAAALSYGTTTHDRHACSYVGSGPSATAGAWIKWTGYDVGIQAWSDDEVRDGYCAVALIRYHVYDNGRWQDHWHYRSSPAVDCSDGNGGRTAQWYGSRKPIKDVHVRACLGDSQGNPARVNGTWLCGPWR